MFKLLAITIFAVASANVIHDGKCPEAKAVDNFDVSQYSGTWYEISKLPNDAEKNGKCASAEYTVDGAGLKVKNIHVVNGVQMYAEGTAKMAADANKSGKLAVTLKFGEVAREVPLTILATDYKHYAVAYTCKYDETKKNHETHAWVLSRTKKLEGDAKTAVDNLMKANAKEIDPTKLINTDLSDEACKFTSSSAITVPAKH